MRINEKIIILVIIGLLIILLFIPEYLGKKIYPLTPKEWFNKSSNPNATRCPADVMQCLNGSYVGRVAPSCSFAPCPGKSK